MQVNSIEKPRKKFLRVILWLLGFTLLFSVVAYTAFKTSPWPGVLLIRYVFERDAERALLAMEQYVPKGIAEQRNEHYDAADEDAYLDAYYPQEVVNSNRLLPVIVWIHGGGWISGKKEHIGNYAKILAGKGFVAVSIDYSIAPAAIYPTPVKQTNAALAYLAQNAQRLHIDASQFVLAGDSGGAHIAAQVANLTAEPAYSKTLGIKASLTPQQIKGLLLFCGPYDIGKVNLEGSFGGFLTTVLWSYSGTTDFMTDPQFKTASVINYVSPAFPPAFISAGNGDPLLPQSQALAEKLAMLKVPVETLFFPADYRPKLPHEYQFNLDNETGQLALERVFRFLQGRKISEQSISSETSLLIER